MRVACAPVKAPLTTGANNELQNAIDALNLDDLTPREAQQALYDLKAKLKK